MGGRFKGAAIALSKKNFTLVDLEQIFTRAKTIINRYRVA